MFWICRWLKKHFFKIIFQSNLTIGHLIFELVICFHYLVLLFLLLWDCTSDDLSVIFFVLIDRATKSALLYTKFYLFFSLLISRRYKPFSKRHFLIGCFQIDIYIPIKEDMMLICSTVLQHDFVFQFQIFYFQYVSYCSNLLHAEIDFLSMKYA